ncbi:hypothetical protein JW960_10640 [candidate division KSB1 bacterium]|nr:hypothetical protein [candidate division KSB1 bacterium]
MQNLNSYIKVLLLISIVFIFPRCDSILPDAYQDEEYKATSEGQSACEYLSREINADSTNCVVVNAVTFNQKVSASSFSTLISTTEALAVNNLNLVQYRAGQDTVHASLSPSAGNVNVYLTWDLDETSINEYINVEAIGSDGNIIKKSSLDLPLETYSACTELVRDSDTGLEEVVSAVRAQYKFKFEQQPYIIRFIITNPTVIPAFRVVILPS